MVSRDQCLCGSYMCCGLRRSIGRCGSIIPCSPGDRSALLQGAPRLYTKHVVPRAYDVRERGGADTGTVVVARALAVDIHAPVVRRCPAACVYKSSHATQASHAAHATRAAAMPPQYAMGELPPPCSTLKNALVQIEGGEESLEGLCPDTMAQSAFQVYHRRACQVIT